MVVLVMLILLLVLGGASYYVSHRMYIGLASFFPKMKFWPVLTILGLLTLFLILSFSRSFLPFSAGVKSVLGVIGSYSMGIMLYLLLSTIFVDIVMLIPQLMRLSFTNHHLYGGFKTIGVLLITTIVCLYGFINVGQIDSVSYEVNIKGKKDISDVKLVMISDLHLGAVGSEDRLAEIVDEINAQNPDLVCIAGDVFDTDFSSISDPDTATNTLKKIKATYGVYACLGNHDGGKTHAQMTAFLKQADIRLLDDQYTTIDDRLILIGRLDKSSIGGYGDKKRQELSSFFVREDATLPVIVLDHNPAHIDEYATEADLILCGHTHKGQVFPGNLITNMIYTVDYGFYQKDSNSPIVIVSSGVGYWGLPMRVGSDCEIVTVNFNCQ